MVAIVAVMASGALGPSAAAWRGAAFRWAPDHQAARRGTRRRPHLDHRGFDRPCGLLGHRRRPRRQTIRRPPPLPPRMPPPRPARTFAGREDGGATRSQAQPASPSNVTPLARARMRTKARSSQAGLAEDPLGPTITVQPGARGLPSQAPHFASPAPQRAIRVGSPSSRPIHERAIRVAPPSSRPGHARPRAPYPPTGIRITTPPITSPSSKSVRGVSAWPLWQLTQAGATAVSA